MLPLEAPDKVADAIAAFRRSPLSLPIERVDPLDVSEPGEVRVGRHDRRTVVNGQRGQLGVCQEWPTNVVQPHERGEDLAEHLCSFDRDFGRFSGVRWTEPEPI